jgi:hypothetical protein
MTINTNYQQTMSQSALTAQNQIASDAAAARSLPTQDETTVCIHTYTDPLKSKTITIALSQTTGLSASIHSNGCVMMNDNGLPLTGLPRELYNLKDLCLLKSYFSHTHLIPEKGTDGIYNRVAVHVSGLGGGGGNGLGEAPIPVQPGLAFGGVVLGSAIMMMQEHASATAALNSLENEIMTAGNEIIRLEKEIAYETKQLDNNKGMNESLTIRISIKNAKKQFCLNNLKELGELIPDQLQKVFSCRKPHLVNFNAAIETPIDMGHSVWECQPRGHDGSYFMTEDISLKINDSEIRNKIMHSSGANSLSGGVELFSNNISGSHSWNESIADRVLAIKQEGGAERILIINSIVSTRQVRCFTNLLYDPRKLKSISEVMKSCKTIEDCNRHGITVQKNGEKALYLLTEEVMSGSFTALVKFSNSTTITRDAGTHQNGNHSTTGLNAQAGYKGIGVNAGFSNAAGSGGMTDDDTLRNTAATRVSIEILTQGAIPTLTLSTMEQKMINHLDLNPAKFELSEKDEADLKEMAMAKGSDKQFVMMKQQMKCENAAVAVLNTCRGLTSSSEQQSIISCDSVLASYVDFVNKMTKDRGCGVPIGFNYTVLTEREINERLVELGVRQKEEGLTSSLMLNAPSNEAKSAPPSTNAPFTTLLSAFSRKSSTTPNINNNNNQ